MTREEAINYLEICTEEAKSKDWADGIKFALAMLEKVAPCEDAISREAVIKLIDEHTFDTADGVCLDDDITCILEELSSVEPSRLHGEWIEEDVWEDAYGYLGGRWQTCSVCKESEHCKTNFCPTCGADMRPKENNNECG